VLEAEWVHPATSAWLRPELVDHPLVITIEALPATEAPAPASASDESLGLHF
jgi:hypothetical protein